MSLWGDRETIKANGRALVGTVRYAAINEDGTITLTTDGQSGSVNFDDVEIGQVLTLENSHGSSYIISVANSTTATLAPSTEISAFNNETIRALVNEKPLYVIQDSSIGANLTFGVDSTEIVTDNNYKPAHAGWVKAQTYTDMHGNKRYKSETLVAMSTIQGDAKDDISFPNS